MSNAFDLGEIKGALFDVDGCLVDSRSTYLEGLREAFARLGVGLAEEEIRRMIGLPLRAQFERYASDRLSESEMEALIDWTEARFEELHQRDLPFADSVTALRLLLQRGVPVALVTSRSSDEIASLKDRFSFANEVQALIGAEDVSQPKPAPDPALLACERLGVSTDSVVLVGDSIFDIRCAKAAGIHAIGVSYGFATRAELEAEKPDRIIDSPAELRSLFETLDFAHPCHERSQNPI